MRSYLSHILPPPPSTVGGLIRVEADEYSAVLIVIADKVKKGQALVMKTPRHMYVPCKEPTMPEWVRACLVAPNMEDEPDEEAATATRSSPTPSTAESKEVKKRKAADDDADEDEEVEEMASTTKKSKGTARRASTTTARRRDRAQRVEESEESEESAGGSSGDDEDEYVEGGKKKRKKADKPAQNKRLRKVARGVSDNVKVSLVCLCDFPISSVSVAL